MGLEPSKSIRLRCDADGCTNVQDFSMSEEDDIASRVALRDWAWYEPEEVALCAEHAKELLDALTSSGAKRWLALRPAFWRVLCRILAEDEEARRYWAGPLRASAKEIAVNAVRLCECLDQAAEGGQDE